MMANVVERLRSDSLEDRQEAAIDISTTGLEQSIGGNTAKQATPLLIELLESGSDEKPGTAAGALARIARDYPDVVHGVEDDLVSMLYDDTIHQHHYYNATQAARAIAAIEATSYLGSIRDALKQIKTKAEEGGTEERAWAATKLAIHYIDPQGTDAVEYEYIRFASGQGVTLLASKRLDHSGSTKGDNTVAAILFDDVLKQKKRKELQKVLWSGVKGHPDKFQEAVSYLAENIRQQQDHAGGQVLKLLREYAKNRPEDLTHLVVDLSSYVDSSHNKKEQLNTVRIVDKVRSVSPDAIAPYREDIQDLQTESAGEIQRHCSRILDTIESQRDSTGSTEPSSEEAHVGSPDEDAVDTGTTTGGGDSGESLDELRDAASEAGEKDVPERTVSTTQSTTEYTRSEKVKQYVKARADGHCEGCGEPAPFTSKTGEPYLHAHHVHELSEGGSDVPQTVISLCPNCHYRVHHGEDGEEYNEKLKQNLRQIEG